MTQQGGSGLRSRPRVPDASMDLLKQIVEHPIDPDYAIVAARRAESRGPGGTTGDRAPRERWPTRLVFGLVVLLIGAMFAVAALQTTRSRPAIQQERNELITRIKTAQNNRDGLREQADALAAENARLRTTGLGDDAQDRALRAKLNGLETATGAAPVSGPGLTVVVDDAPGGNGQNRVLDVDLQILVNGLWAAGAEAVQINDQRVTNLTAIREAGQAITVNYRSLTPPYTVRAIGDQRRLQARLLETSAGPWWNALKQNQGMRYDVTAAERLDLDGVPGITVRTGRTR
ncbi:DUF881 domain-containing protein [Microlunatus soli]|uniref:Uncharacterized conserved protein YlxW, UPF0749 family n=1 Tax=Microlunatus soli TaxID=630515 RepID=A0A1H2AN73_9ACTN|nr:DUF881 domain-containing protein [Microlunatus soli]SDT47222.1 Uncharacterized conserved protein YlxW, UPF0749 family [Microlunatus soli]